ncbi:MAG: hypothetical protein HQL51_14925 [Magnetococcales bacterium]|nr:hypothetical protein [Magnetococcales bacterium]
MISAHRFLTQPPESWDDATLARMERAFFNDLVLPSGATKSTEAGRLATVDAFFLDQIQPTGLSPRRFLDVAVSSGITTDEWLSSLHTALGETAGLSMTGSDLTPKAWLVEFPLGLRVLVDRAMRPLQFDLGGLAWSGACRRPSHYLTGCPVWRALARGLWGRVTAELSLAGKFPLTADRPLVCLGGRVTVREVSLLSRRLRHGAVLRVEEEDLMAPGFPEWAGAFDVIRVANLLHPCYFPLERLKQGLEVLARRLHAPGGLLLLARTVEARGAPPRNEATLFRLDEAGRLVAAGRLNGGVEVEPLVLALAPIFR